MAPMSRKYDERTLCPLRVKAEWWYRLPSQTRKRIALEIEEQGAPVGLLIGEVQDRLIARKVPRMMGTFMVAMQEGYDADADEAELLIGEVQVEWTPPEAAVEGLSEHERQADPDLAIGLTDEERQALRDEERQALRDDADAEL